MKGSQALAQAQQTVAATEQSLWAITGIFLGVVIISYTFSFAVTHFAKAWRSDHNERLLSPSSSLLRATLLAFSAFVGLWYVSFSLGIIHAFSWLVAILLGLITAPIAPLMWNPLAETAGKLRDALIAKVK